MRILKNAAVKNFGWKEGDLFSQKILDFSSKLYENKFLKDYFIFEY